MRITLLLALAALCFGPLTANAATPEAFVKDLALPESVCIGPGGHLYVTEIGERMKTGDGKVTVIKNGKAESFATGLDDPKGIVFFKDTFYVTDVTKVVKISAQGKVSDFLPADKFPSPPLFLNDIAIEGPTGQFLITDSGDRMGKGGKVYLFEAGKNKVTTIVSNETIPNLNMPNGVTFDGAHFCIFADMNRGTLHRVCLGDRTVTDIAEGMDGADGLAWDYFGRLFITSWKTGKVFAIPRPGQQPILIGEGLQSAADCCVAPNGKDLLIPDMKAGTLTKISTTIPGWEVDDSPAPVELKVAFPDLKWTGWDDGSESGRANPLRPIVLTHANDKSNRVFVAIQQGTIHVFDNKDDAKATKVFLDITKRVRYSDKQNEEGLLGLCFHPKYRENGEFFVFYTDVKAKMANVVSRFKVKKDDPNAADPASEEEIIRFEKPYWNHDGGTIAFGPDGYLYITHGDGGAGNDPHENGQNTGVLLGKVLRIDVDKPSAGKKYSIPKDNPFVGKAGFAPEIFAYGFRNIWRFAFDSKTGDLWAGEVGQNLFEEIVIIKAGGNYGWNLRESLHPFGNKGVGERADLIDPIWEYHHDIGRSITGGVVYRGKAVPELDGAYLYADYVSSAMWALRYDAAKGRVVANHPIKNPQLVALSFGEDDQGEAYVLTASGTGRGIYRFAKAAK